MHTSQFFYFLHEKAREESEKILFTFYLANCLEFILNFDRYGLGTLYTLNSVKYFNFLNQFLIIEKIKQ